jgi:hypothetical protein
MFKKQKKYSQRNRKSSSQWKISTQNEINLDFFYSSHSELSEWNGKIMAGLMNVTLERVHKYMYLFLSHNNNAHTSIFSCSYCLLILTTITFHWILFINNSFVSSYQYHMYKWLLIAPRFISLEQYVDDHQQ